MSKLKENYLSRGDVNTIFKAATKLKDTSHLAPWDRYRDEISVDDLQQDWKEDGYSIDIRDIESILKNRGFGKREISKVFKEVLGKGDHPDYGYDTGATSPAVGKLVDVIEKAGLKKEVIAFLEKNFKDEIEDDGWISKVKRKFTTEDIRDIFTSIVNEERTEREALLKQHETQQFGRKRK